MNRPLRPPSGLPRSALVLVSLALTATIAAAAPAQPERPLSGSAAVNADAPVYLRPNRSLTPLRTLPTGTLVTVRATEGEWAQITFADQQFGQRTGWIESRFLTPVARPKLEEPDVPEEEAAAPEPLPPARGVRRRVEPPSGRVFGLVAADRMTAERSFDALFGSDVVRAFGGGIQGVNLWHGLFAEVSAEWSRETGERVFVTGGEVFPLGIPMKVTIIPVDLVGGWRARIVRPFVYGGAGITFVRYKETSDFAAEGDDIDENYRGFVALAGVEVPVTRWIHVRGEVRYRRVDDVLGVGGVSAAFGETELGGVGFGIKVGFGR